MRDRIAHRLIYEIDQGFWPVDARLPSRRALARHFETSTKPVQSALDMLEQRGFVELRHGSGTYVRDRLRVLPGDHRAALCVDACGHVYDDLTRVMLRGLHDLHILTTVLDIGHGNGSEMLQQACNSGARFLAFQAGTHFPYAALDAATLAGKHIIALFGWHSEILSDRVHRIEVDHAGTSRILADHLWSTGHRRLLLAGPEDMLQVASTLWDGEGDCPREANLQGTGFPAMWIRRGGRIKQLCCMRENHDATIDERLLYTLLHGRHAPTAVVGMRDVDAWDVRETLRQVYPEALPRLTFVGNGDTPWSQTASPPFTTLRWNLRAMTDAATGIVREIESGRSYGSPVEIRIPSLLVAR